MPFELTQNAKTDFKIIVGSVGTGEGILEYYYGENALFGEFMW